MIIKKGKIRKVGTIRIFFKRTKVLKTTDRLQLCNNCEIGKNNCLNIHIGQTGQIILTLSAICSFYTNVDILLYYNRMPCDYCIMYIPNNILQ